jgi:prepilin-type processing-associated H-X9-DG protein
MPARSRRGLSLIELVVILFVILLILALVLPAVNTGRRRPRRNQCLHNMRQVGIAIQAFASQNAGVLPPLEDGTFGWSRSLLKALDQPAVDRQITSGEWSPERPPLLQVFTCPQDEDSFQQPGGLSYVTNGGYGFFPFDSKNGVVTERGRHSLDQDWNGDGAVSDKDRQITKATGVFWRPEKSIRKMTLDFIGENDGAGSTLLLTENLHAGPWTSRDARAIAFVIGRNRLTFDPNAGPLAVAQSDLGPFAINGAKEMDGPIPAPSSNHNGSVNVIWADGRGGGFSEQIDPSVYVRILTPAGSRYGQQLVNDAEIGG